MPTARAGKADARDATPRHRGDVPLSRVFRLRTIDRDGRVVGCWFTTGAKVEDAPEPPRGYAGGYGRECFRVVDPHPRTKTWCTGIALMLGPKEAAAIWFDFEAGMGDPEVEHRACRGTMRRDTPRPRGEPVFASSVHLLQVLLDDRWLNSALKHALITFDEGAPTQDDIRDAVLGMREHARTFIDTLDPVALSLLETNEEAILNGPWWGIDPGLGRGAPLRAALDGHPHMRGEILRAWQFRCHDLTDAVAAGRPLGMLSDFLLSTRKGEPSHATDLAMAERAYATSPVDWDHDGIRSHDMPYDLPSAFKAVMRVVCAADRPRDEKGWSAALHAVKGIRMGALAAGYRNAVTFLDVDGDWAGWKRRIDGETNGAPIGQSIEDMRDVVKAFERQLLVPALRLAGRDGAAVPRNVHDPQVAASLLWSGSRLRRCLALSARWHARRPAMDAAIARQPQVPRLPDAIPAARWQAGLPDMDLGDLSVVVLTDPGQLEDEGRHGTNADGTEGLRHCVAGYGPECRSGRHRIVSLRRREGDGFVRVSTAEILVDGQGEGFTVRQHRAIDNKAPPRRATALLDRYMAGLADGTLPVSRASFAWLAGGREHRDQVEDAGYDWGVEGAWEEVSRLWRPYLPRTLRDLSPADWAAARGSCVEEERPDIAYWRPLPWEVPPPGPAPAGP